jgi:protein-S-isoprenylcysteine O-methyltransferase Ste14
MNEAGANNYAYGMWSIVLLNVLLFFFFAINFIKPKKKFEWRSMGAFGGFLVALFTEMYGVPLTIYLLATWLGKSYPAVNPFSHANGHLLLVFLGLADSSLALIVLHLISYGIILFGFYIIYRGWKLIHASKNETLVTKGVYSHLRHPQYSGLFLITFAFLIMWPSFTALIMWLVIIYAYYRLAKREEKVLEKQFGKTFWIYKREVPAFVPQIHLGGRKQKKNLAARHILPSKE